MGRKKKSCGMCVGCKSKKACTATKSSAPAPLGSEESQVLPNTAVQVNNPAPLLASPSNMPTRQRKPTVFFIPTVKLDSEARNEYRHKGGTDGSASKKTMWGGGGGGSRQLLLKPLEPPKSEEVCTKKLMLKAL